MTRGQTHEQTGLDLTQISRVWIVGENRTARRDLEQVLGDHFEVALFADGPSMLERLRAEPPSLILLDRELPMMSGLEVCRLVRQHGHEVDLPILMVTASVGPSVAAESLAAGANDILRTPFEPAELLARARSLLLPGQLAGSRRFVPAVDVTETVRARRRAADATDELVASQRSLLALLTSIGDAVISADRDLRITFANPVAEELTGWTSHEMKGTPLSEVFRILHQATRAVVASPAEAAVREGHSVGLANHTVLVRRDGVEIAIEDSASPIRDGDDAVIGAVLVFRDVRARARVEAERCQHTRHLELAATVSAALAGPEALDAQLRTCVEAMVQQTEAAFARIWTIAAVGTALELRAGARSDPDMDGPHARVVSAPSKIAWIAASGRSHVTNDVSRDPEIADRAWAIRERIQAFAGLPIVVDARVIGVMELFSRHMILDGTVRLMATVADQLAIGIERARVSAQRERARASAESHRVQLSALFARAPVAIAVLRGRAYVVELANPHVCAIWGRTEQQVLGKPFFEALPEVAGQGIDELLDRVVRTGLPYVGTELLVKLARGSGHGLEDVYFNFVYQPTYDDAGAVDAILVVATDVTENVRTRRKTEELAEALREREERLRLALAASEAGAWEVDLVTRVIEADSIVRDLFHLRPDQQFTLELGLAAIHPDESARVALHIERALGGANGGAFHEQYRIVARDGSTAWIDSRGQALFDADGNARRFLGTLVNIDERKQLETMREALLVSEHRAREGAEQQRDFEQYVVGIVSHDLRSPLQAILMGAELLLGTDKLDAMSNNVLVRVKNNAERATRLIRDVLDFTQARLGGGFALRRSSVDLRDIAREVVDELGIAEPARVLVLTASGNTTGEWDADRLSQVVSNLATNAIKYSSRDSTISVAVLGSPGEVELAVHNTGSVIPEDRIARLFLALTRHAGDDRNVQRSVGLGLFIVQSIVTSHGGRVTVTSTVDTGTTFRVILPKSAPRDPA